MLRFFSCLLIVFSFVSCEKKNFFEINGTITNAEGQVLFLEENALTELILIDSVVLSSDGEFALKGLSPDHPQFYRLRLNKEYIHFSIDSTEEVTVFASADSLFAYQVTGSDDNVKIKQLFQLVRHTNDKIRTEKNDFEKNRTISQDSLNNLIFEIVLNYKDQVRNIVISNPQSPAAYFGIFQKLIYNITPFSLSDKEDLKYYSAVATAWNAFHKESLRAKQLYNMVIDARKSIRKEHIEKFTENNSIGYIDITLPDKRGNMQSLSSLKGNVILLDFCSYLQLSPYDIIELRDLYAKNHAVGFEIYQISFDKDLSFWKKTIDKFPWICVNDSSLSTSVTYNVTQLPTNYLIDKKGNIIGKNITPEKIRKYLTSVR